MVKPPLLNVQLADEAPHVPKNQRLKGTAAKGKTYERKFGRELRDLIAAGKLSGELYRQQWLMFTDQEGFNFAQPDCYVVQSNRVWLFECKRTENKSACDQLILLYRPLLQFLYELPVYCVQVCKNIRANANPEWRGELVDHIDQALALEDELCTFHYIDQ